MAARKKIKLKSSESSHCYTTSKNDRVTEKISIKKYDPTLRKHVVYKEEKIK